MAVDIHIPHLREVGIFLGVAAVLVPVLHRFKLSPVLGFLVAGLLIGPYGLVSVPTVGPLMDAIAYTDIEAVRAVGEVGVIFLLFLIGLELAPSRLWAMRRLIFGLGAAQVAVCGAVIALVASFWGNTIAQSIIIGAALSLSSTAIVMKMIMDKKKFATPFGQTGFSILLFQDLAVIPLIFLVVLLGQGMDQGQGGAMLAYMLGKAVIMSLAIIVAGRFLARPFLRWLVKGSAGPEFFMAYIVLMVMGSAVLTGMAGLSLALGAFLAGLVFADTEFRHQIEIDVEPFKGLFLGLFFISVGMSIDLRAIWMNPHWFAFSVFGLFILKAILIAGLCRAFGLLWPLSVRVGISLGQAGEFAFILLGLAIVNGAVEGSVAQFMMLITSLTMALTPLAFWLGGRAEKILSRRVPYAADQSIDQMAMEAEDHVIIAGFGRTGRAVAKHLEEEQIPYLAIEHNVAHLEVLRQLGIPVFYGDSSNPQMLEKVHASHARAVVICLTDKTAIKKIVETVRASYPDLVIFSRAKDEGHAAELKAIGVQGVVLETEALSHHLAQKVLQRIGGQAPPIIT